MKIVIDDLRVKYEFERKDAKTAFRTMFPNGGEKIDKIASMVLTNDRRYKSAALDLGFRIVG